MLLRMEVREKGGQTADDEDGRRIPELRVKERVWRWVLCCDYCFNLCLHWGV